MPKFAANLSLMYPEIDFLGFTAKFKVKGTVDGYPFQSSFMALGDGTHKLPVKAELRKVIGKEAGDTVTVCLQERLGRPGVDDSRLGVGHAQSVDKDGLLVDPLQEVGDRREGPAGPDHPGDR